MSPTNLVIKNTWVSVAVIIGNKSQGWVVNTIQGTGGNNVSVNYIPVLQHCEENVYSTRSQRLNPECFVESLPSGQMFHLMTTFKAVNTAFVCFFSPACLSVCGFARCNGVWCILFYGETSHRTNLFVSHPGVVKWSRALFLHRFTCEDQLTSPIEKHLFLLFLFLFFWLLVNCWIFNSPSQAALKVLCLVFSLQQ